MATTGKNDNLPEGLTLSLALMDAVPVAPLCASAATFGTQVGSPLFVAGATLSFLGGEGKVSWKLLIALAQRNYPVLSKQMRVTMPLGFFAHDCGRGALARSVTLPSIALVVAWAGCMCVMGYFAGHRNQFDARSN